MTHRRCCDDPANWVETREGRDLGDLVLVCLVCGTVLAHSDERGELFADL